jgi:hypothetical protein
MDRFAELEPNLGTSLLTGGAVRLHVTGMKSNTVLLGVRVPVDLAREIRWLARQRDLTMSQILRAAIRRELRGGGDGAA